MAKTIFPILFMFYFFFFFLWLKKRDSITVVPIDMKFGIPIGLFQASDYTTIFYVNPFTTGVPLIIVFGYIPD